VAVCRRRAVGPYAPRDSRQRRRATQFAHPRRRSHPPASRTAAVPTTRAELCDDVRPVVVESSSSHHRRTRSFRHRAKWSMDCSTRVFVYNDFLVRGGDYKYASVEGMMMLKTTTTTSNDDGSDDMMRMTAL